MVVFLRALFLPHLLFCTLLLFLCAADIDILRALGSVYQKRDTVVHDLSKSCPYRKFSPLLFSCQLDFGRTYSNGYDHIFMIWQDPFLSVRSRDDEFSTAALIKDLVTCYDFQTKCIHYAYTPVLLCTLTLPHFLLLPSRSRHRSFPH